MSDSPTQSPTDIQDEFKKVTEQLYEHNLELAVRNKTFEVLGKLYGITMSSLNIADVSKRIIETIVNELHFSAASIVLVDRAQQSIKIVAVSKTLEDPQISGIIGKSFTDISIPFTHTTNLLVQAISSKQVQTTGNLLDVFNPEITQEEADKIENLTNIQTLISYPLYFGGKALGVLLVGFDKKVEDLSRAESETLQELISLVGIAIDRAQLYEDVQKANEELKKLDNLKDEFLSMASHELKSPMNAVKNYLWMAMKKGGDNKEKMNEYLQTAYSATNRLVILVNDLLDVSRIESGRITLDLKPLPVAQIIKETEDMYAPQAKEKGLQLITNVPADITVKADDQKLREVLNNFISNAIKYTPTGSVTVTATKEQNTVKISVTDTGKGISVEDQQKLFQKFSRVNNSFKELAAIEGTGLGLWIAKQFVELMGGTIGVDSTVDVGSTFWITLPRN